MGAPTHSVTLDGLSGRPIEIEVDIGGGLPATVLVGLADTMVNEARDRCRSAVSNSGTTWPDQRVTINLAPARLTLGVHCSGEASRDLHPCLP